MNHDPQNSEPKTILSLADGTLEPGWAVDAQWGFGHVENQLSLITHRYLSGEITHQEYLDSIRDLLPPGEGTAP